MRSAVDTNVLVRFLVDDGSNQVAPARRIFANEPVYVPLSVMLETEWVLRSNFGYPRTLICEAFDRLLGFGSVQVQNADIVQDAIEALRGGLDFADALHLYSSPECDCLHTFDKGFVRKSKRLPGTIPVRRPALARSTN